MTYYYLTNIFYNVGEISRVEEEGRGWSCNNRHCYARWSPLMAIAAGGMSLGLLYGVSL